MICKPIGEIKILDRYTVLRFNKLPTTPYKKIKVGSRLFEVVPVYDAKNCIAVESTDSFLNSQIEFVL